MENEEKEKDLFCPLFIIADLTSSASTAYCLQEKCAWWHEDKCAITQLAHAKTHGKWMQLIPM